MDRRALAAAMFAATLAISGCSATGGTAQTCIDWVFFDTPSDAADEADAIIVGDVIEQADTTTYLDLPATTWNVRVDTWLDGDDGDEIEEGEEIVVTSLPHSCGVTGDTLAAYADVDSLLFFLREGDEGWEILTPYQGVLPTEPGSTIPAEWPEAHHH